MAEKLTIFAAIDGWRGARSTLVLSFKLFRLSMNLSVDSCLPQHSNQEETSFPNNEREYLGSREILWSETEKTHGNSQALGSLVEVESNWP